MATVGEILEKLVPSVISGAGTALATVYGYLNDLKKRVADLEKRLGTVDQDTGSRSGMLGVIEKLQKKVESIEGASDSLVENLDRLEAQVKERKEFSSADVSFFEDRIHDRLKKDYAILLEKIEKLEKRVEIAEGKIAQCQTITEAQKEREQREASLQRMTETVGRVQGHIESLRQIIEKFLKLPKLPPSPTVTPYPCLPHLPPYKRLPYRTPSQNCLIVRR